MAEIFVPGERGQRRRAALREREAVPLSAATWEYLRQAATATGVALPDGATSD